MFHFSKDLSRTHGVPFKFVVKRVCSLRIPLERLANSSSKGEKFADTKKRLQARIGVTDKDILKYRFALIQASTFKQPSYIEDGEPFHSSVDSLRTRLLTLQEDDSIYDHQFAPEDVLGLDHIDKTGRTRAGGAEKAIVIRG